MNQDTAVKTRAFQQIALGAVFGSALMTAFALLVVGMNKQSSVEARREYVQQSLGGNNGGLSGSGPSGSGIRCDCEPGCPLGSQQAGAHGWRYRWQYESTRVPYYDNYQEGGDQRACSGGNNTSNMCSQTETLTQEINGQLEECFCQESMESCFFGPASGSGSGRSNPPTKQPTVSEQTLNRIRRFEPQ